MQSPDGWGSALAPPARPEAAGLVLSKTSPNSEFLINLDRGSCVLRRIKYMRRGLWAAATQLSLPRPGFRPDVSWFITLTFAEADTWEPKHLSRATDRYHRWCIAHGVECRYAWVAEIQGKRAERTGQHVVHYHLIAWLPHGVTMPKWDVACGRRRAFWPHGMTNTQIAKAGVGYLMKYVSKMGEFSDFPKGLRLSGKGGLNEQADQSVHGSIYPSGLNAPLGWETLSGSRVVLWCKQQEKFLSLPTLCPLCPVQSLCSPLALFQRNFTAGLIRPCRKSRMSHELDDIQ